MKPKILIYDIETSPMLAWIWRIGNKISVSHSQIEALGDIICICYKWVGGKETYALDWGAKQDSTRMLKDFEKVIKDADVVIAHNGDRFDVKHINTQRLLKGLDPLAWPTSEDTLKMLRRHFTFPCFKLDFLSGLLTGSGKDKMEFQDWISIVRDKDEKALAKMIKYCKKDVRQLEQVFLSTKKYLTPIAHRGIIIQGDRDSCPSCGSLDRIKNGSKIKRTGRHQTYQCKDCGHVSTDTRKLP